MQAGLSVAAGGLLDRSVSLHCGEGEGLDPAALAFELLLDQLVNLLERSGVNQANL